MSESDSAPKSATPKPGDVESLLRQRDELDRVIREQFQRRVAVIFTDIQGSTQYFERYGDLAGRAMVQRHNDLLFPLIAEGGGRVVKTIGDAIMAFFENSASAVQAAMRMQRALTEKNEVWPERERIDIRIGVHVGEALVDSADVYGDTVNTAARIEAQASGGEILISDAVRAELGAGAPTLRARGAVKLKGKAAEVPLYEVRWRDRDPVSVAVKAGKGRWGAIGAGVFGAIVIAAVSLHAAHKPAAVAAPASAGSSASVAATPAAAGRSTPAATPASTGSSTSLAATTAPASASAPATHPAVRAPSSQGPAPSPASSAAPAPTGSAASAGARVSTSRIASAPTSGATSPRASEPSVASQAPSHPQPTPESSPQKARHHATRARVHAPSASTGTAAQRAVHPAVAHNTETARPTGTVRIHVFPYADVFIDGKQVGKGTMDLQVTVPAGDHRLRLVHPAFPEKNLTLHVKPGANEEQDILLNR